MINMIVGSVGAVVSGIIGAMGRAYGSEKVAQKLDKLIGDVVEARLGEWLRSVDWDETKLAEYVPDVVEDSVKMLFSIAPKWIKRIGWSEEAIREKTRSQVYGVLK